MCRYEQINDQLPLLLPFSFFWYSTRKHFGPNTNTLVHYYELVACINSFMTATRAKLTKCYRPLKQSSPHFPNGHLKTVSHLTMAKLKYIIFSPSRRKFLNVKSYLSGVNNKITWSTFVPKIGLEVTNKCCIKIDLLYFASLYSLLTIFKHFILLKVLTYLAFILSKINYVM